MKLTNKALKKRIIEISYKHKLSHLGSCLTAVDIIEEIYNTKKPNEPFILSSGHAGLALYVVIEKHEGIDAEDIFNHHGVHPDRCLTCHLYCSTGSLGSGLPIAVGMALADRTKNVYCLISDGECSEGSIWESMRIATENKLSNLRVFVNYNGWGAYKEIDSLFMDLLEPQVQVIETKVEQLPFLKGQDAHYLTMNEQQYQEALEILK